MTIPGPAPVILVDCPDCLNYASTQPHLVGACASAGIAHGISTGHMLRLYLNAYHQNGHKETGRGR